MLLHICCFGSFRKQLILKLLRLKTFFNYFYTLRRLLKNSFTSRSVAQEATGDQGRQCETTEAISRAQILA